MVNFGFCTDSDFLFSCTSGASIEHSGSLQQKQEVNLACRTKKRTKRPKGKGARSSSAVLLSQTRFLNKMDLILERQVDMFGSHSSASVSQPPSDANSPPCKTQRVTGEMSSLQKLLL